VAAVVVTVVIAVIAIVVAPEMLPGIALGLGLAIASMTGGTQDLQKLLAGALVKAGVPPEIANITVDVAILAVTIIAAVLTGNAMGVETAAEVGTGEAAEVGVEAAGEASEDAASQAAQAMKNFLSKPGELFTRLTRAIGPKAGLAILCGSEVLGGLPLARDVVSVLPIAQKEKDKLLPIFEAIQMIIALIGALVGGGAFSTAATSTLSEVDESAGMLKQAAQKLRLMLQTLNENMEGLLPSLQKNLLRLDAGLNLSASLGSAALGTANSNSELKIARATKKLGPVKGDWVLANTTLEMANAALRKTVKQSNQDLENLGYLYDGLSHFGDVWQTVAQQTA